MSVLATALRWFDALTQRRSLWRRPGYALTVIFTLALGIGGVTAVFALLQGVMLNALPYPESDRLVLVRQQNPGGSWNTSVVDFRAMAASSTTLESVAAMRAGSALVGHGDNATWTNARWVSAGFFDVLGVRPQHGRGFLANEDRAGADAAVVLGQAFAERQFAGRGDPLGQSLDIDGKAHTVVGVMPAGVESWPVVRADFWPVMQLAEPTRRGPFQLATIARMKKGVTLEQTAADLDVLSRRLFTLWQQGFQDDSARLTPQSLHGAVVGGVGRFLWIAFAGVAVVMLIAWINTANLMLMRVAQRMQDLGVRAALGASRWRLARLLMGESVALVAFSTLAGLALAKLLLDGYRALGPALPRLSEVALSPDVLAFAAALGVITAIAFALLPLVLGVVGDATTALQPARGASTGKRPQRLRDSLVVLEFALALPLLIASGLLVDSLMRLQRVDPGFEAGKILSARLRLSDQSYPDDSAQAAFWARALPALRALPGVQSVALTGVLPPSCGCFNNFSLLGRPPADGVEPQAPWIAVDAGYFETLGVRLLEGRMFDTRDTPESARVLLVSESWAKHYFPGESPVGKQLYEGGNTEQALEVIGVVGDVKYNGLDNAGDSVFAPISQGWGGNEMYVLLRTATEPLSVADAMRSTLQELDPALVPTDVEAIATLLSDSLGGQKHWAAVITAFALSAVLLAAAGVFAVFAYHVAQRQREIGIRQALGANGGHIVASVLRRGLTCALIGVVLGSAFARLLTQGLDALLFEVKPTDPLTWVAAWALLLVVALLACGLPALRAARVDPLIALRQE